MSAQRKASPGRPTNVTLPEALLHDARALGINQSQVCDCNVSTAVHEARRRWLADNRGTLEAYNDQAHGHLPA